MEGHSIPRGVGDLTRKPIDPLMVLSMSASHHWEPVSMSLEMAHSFCSGMMEKEPFVAFSFLVHAFVSSAQCCLAMCPHTLGGLGEAALGRNIALLPFTPSGTKACILNIP